jgi:phosphoglucosamine mutase
VVISASHNPYQDNGIKIFARDGFKLPDETEAEIERLMAGPELDRTRPQGEVGKARRIDDAVGRYVVFLKGVFPRDRTLDGLRVIVDCANGAGYKVAPAVLSELGADVEALAIRPDGKNINKGCGALHPDHACKSVRKYRADIGIALDGDADRVIFSDEEGNVVDGDAIMAMLAARMIKAGTLSKQTVVATVMSNLGLERALAGLGGRLVRTQVGDRYVVEEMRRAGYNFGGEQSGHLIFLDHMTTGDGMVAALQVMAMMAETGRPLSELARGMTRYPQVLVNVKVREKRPLESLLDVVQLIEKIEHTLGQEGRVLVRYSGTEPKVRVMVEGPDASMIQEYADDIARALERACA